MENCDHLICESRVCGLKQTVRSIENGKAKLVYIARDAEGRLISKVKDLAKSYNVKIQMIDTMSELGKMAGLKVEASTVAILKD